MSGRERGTTSVVPSLVWEIVPSWGDAGPNATSSEGGLEIGCALSLDSEPPY